FPQELDYSVETSLNPLSPPVSTKVLTPISAIPLTGPITEPLVGSLSEPFVKAVVVLRSNGLTHGVIHLVQVGGGPTHISGHIIGLTPLYSHGFHFHEKPVTVDCESAGEHYNPTHQTHGGPNDPSAHIGDLGNIEADLKGISRVHIIDHKVSLIGKYSVIGRSLVVHKYTDDLGAGLNRESRTSGNSGGRLACGTVRFVKYVKP
ncbi:unnamed protein product, partial [Oppiella nova]